MLREGLRVLIGSNNNEISAGNCFFDFSDSVLHKFHLEFVQWLINKYTKCIPFVINFPLATVIQLRQILNSLTLFQTM